MSSILLAIDTSTAWAGVALYDGAPRFELNWRAERRHSEQILPMIAQALALTSIEREDLGAIAVARGPGSYTGVRVGITLARTLGHALDITVLGIESLAVLAYPHRELGLPIRPLLEAGRGRYASALYRPVGARLERVGGLQSVTDDQIAGLVAERTVVCGELSGTLRATLERDLGERVVIPSPSGQMRRSAALAEMAWQSWQAGDSAVMETDPIYVTRDEA